VFKYKIFSEVEGGNMAKKKKEKSLSIEELKKAHEESERQKHKIIEETLSEEEAKGLTIYERTKKRVRKLEELGSLFFDYFEPGEEETIFDEIYSMELAKDMKDFLAKSKEYYHRTMAIAIVSIILAIVTMLLSFRNQLGLC
jgi:6-phosphofructokinase